MRGGSRSRSLTVYLAGLVTLALLPLGIIAVFQTRMVISATDEISRKSLLARTFAAAGEEREMLQKAVGAGSGLAAFVTNVAEDRDACSSLMRSFVTRQTEFIFAGFVEPSGRMACSSLDEMIDFSDTPGFAALLAEPKLDFSVNQSELATEQSVMIVTQPVFDEGTLKGFVKLSIPHVLTRDSSEDLDLNDGIIIALFDAEGELLASNAGLDKVQDFLPPLADNRLVLSHTGQTFSSTTPTGEDRIFAVTSLIPGEVDVIGSWPREEALASVGPGYVGLTLAFPILMWVAGLGVALWGLHRMVIRHLNSLSTALRRFALGDRAPMPTLQDAPEEFQYIRTAFNRMALLVGEAEARTDKDLQEKTILLREVHHRVKNNLQLVASIMNMHARTANTPEARRLLTQLQRRFRGLAMVHHTLNDDSEMTTIDTRTLIDRLVSELAQPAPINGQHVEVTTEAAPVELGQDQSVALSMLLAESLTNAAKYVGIPDDGKPEIAVRLAETAPGELILSVRNTCGETPEAKAESILTSSGIGQRLMEAFVAQIGGTGRVIETPEHYTYEVTFQVIADDPMHAPRDLPEGQDGDAASKAAR
jgi:two-component sensor histidine kinase